MNLGGQKNRHFHAWLAIVLVSLAPGAYGSITVPAGGSISLGSGAMDLGCTDITVAGNLLLGSAPISNVRDVSLQAVAAPGSMLDAGSGSITLSGNWTNGGNFIPGTSAVSFVDNAGCATSSLLSGNTTFYDLSLVSGVGKSVRIPPGTTQSVQHALTVQGTVANPIQIASGTPGSPGFLNLNAGGTQNISHVGVSDNWATGQPLAPLLSNEGGAGNSRGWFGIPLNFAVPAISAWGIALLSLIVAVIGWRRRRLPVQRHQLLATE